MSLTFGSWHIARHSASMSTPSSITPRDTFYVLIKGLAAPSPENLHRVLSSRNAWNEQLGSNGDFIWPEFEPKPNTKTAVFTVCSDVFTAFLQKLYPTENGSLAHFMRLGIPLNKNAPLEPLRPNFNDFPGYILEISYVSNPLALAMLRKRPIRVPPEHKQRLREIKTPIKSGYFLLEATPERLHTKINELHDALVEENPNLDFFITPCKPGYFTSGSFKKKMSFSEVARGNADSNEEEKKQAPSTQTASSSRQSKKTSKPKPNSSSFFNKILQPDVQNMMASSNLVLLSIAYGWKPSLNSSERTKISLNIKETMLSRDITLHQRINDATSELIDHCTTLFKGIKVIRFYKAIDYADRLETMNELYKVDNFKSIFFTRDCTLISTTNPDNLIMDLLVANTQLQAGHHFIEDFCETYCKLAASKVAIRMYQKCLDEVKHRENAKKHEKAVTTYISEISKELAKEFEPETLEKAGIDTDIVTTEMNNELQGKLNNEQNPQERNGPEILDAQVQALYEENATKQEEIDSLEQQNQELLEENEELKTTLEHTNDNLTSLEATFDQHQEKAQQLIAQLQNEITNLRTEFEQERSRDAKQRINLTREISRLEEVIRQSPKSSQQEEDSKAEEQPVFTDKKESKEVVIINTTNKQKYVDGEYNPKDFENFQTVECSSSSSQNQIQSETKFNYTGPGKRQRLEGDQQIIVILENDSESEGDSTTMVEVEEEEEEEIEVEEEEENDEEEEEVEEYPGDTEDESSHQEMVENSESEEDSELEENSEPEEDSESEDDPEQGKNMEVEDNEEQNSGAETSASEAPIDSQSGTF